MDEDSADGVLTETRKVQAIRGSTYTVSIPKQWVEMLGIEKGTSVSLQLLGDRSIMLSLPPAADPLKLEYELYPSSVDGEEVFREIGAAYVAGYRTVRIHFAKEQAQAVHRTVLNVCERIRGLEIVETSAESILLQDFLDPLEFNARQGLRRMQAEVHAMLEVASRLALSGEETTDIDIGALHRHGKEIESLKLILLKQHNLMMRDFRIAPKVGIPMEEALNYLLVAQHLGRIGTFTAQIGENRGFAPDFEGTELLPRIREACTLAIRATDDAMSAFFKRDTRLAHDTIRLHGELQQIRMTAPLDLALSPAELCRIHVFIFLERIGFYARGIAEVAINQTIAPASNWWPGESE